MNDWKMNASSLLIAMNRYLLRKKARKFKVNGTINWLHPNISFGALGDLTVLYIVFNF